MKEVIYDWLGLNEWLFKALYALNAPAIEDAWEILSYGYSCWAIALIVLAVSFRYLTIRHTAPERQFEIMSEFLVTLFIASSIVWCCVYTFQNISLYTSPWVLLPELVTLQKPLLWHEGLPASASAISMMIARILWPYAKKVQKQALILYVVAGCLLSIVSGINWPVDVLAGALLGLIGVSVARWYFRLGTKLAGTKTTC